MTATSGRLPHPRSATAARYANNPLSHNPLNAESSARPSPALPGVPAPPLPAPGGPATGGPAWTGYRSGGHASTGHRSGGHASTGHRSGGDSDADMLIRPFIVTGGRTEPLRDGLRMETLIAALPAALSAPLRFELRRIVEMCQVPRSVAEIATRLAVPLGVARVLVGDLITEGLVNYSYQESSELPIHIIERILAGVRAL